VTKVKKDKSAVRFPVIFVKKEKLNPYSK
jgi:hypothetical protein